MKYVQVTGCILREAMHLLTSLGSQPRKLLMQMMVADVGNELYSLTTFTLFYFLPKFGTGMEPKGDLHHYATVVLLF